MAEQKLLKNKLIVEFMNPRQFQFWTLRIHKDYIELQVKTKLSTLGNFVYNCLFAFRHRKVQLI